MSHRFLISVAATALIAGTGFANAQGTGMSREAPAAAQQSAPSSEPGGAAPGAMKHDGKTTPSPGMKSSQTEPKQPAAGANQRAEDSKMPGQKSKSTASENEGARDTTKGGKDVKAEDRNGSMSREKSASDTKSMNGKSQTTTGQAGAGAKLSGEQRTRITTVIRGQHIAPTTNVNFSIAVGTRVPRTVEFHPLPVEVVTIYPEWRGYNFILVNDQILVIDPLTFEIVAVIEA